MNNNPIIGYREFTDGATRPIYDDGRQYVIDDDGLKLYGVWVIPKEEAPPHLIVPADEDKQ